MYPETVRQGHMWLDDTGGHNSVLAAVLRQADGSGLARGSNWCPGLNTNDEHLETADLLPSRHGDASASTSQTGM